MKLRAIPPMENEMQQKVTMLLGKVPLITDRFGQNLPSFLTHVSGAKGLNFQPNRCNWCREEYIALLLKCLQLVTDRNKYCSVYGT
jgi:hypothetical protein